jgi:hypothetical protein
MAQIANPGLHPITLPSRHVVPAKGVLETSNEIILASDATPMLQALALSGAITLTLDPEPEEPKAKK